MKANELRIGNLVLNNKDEIYKIKCINEEIENKIKPIKLTQDILFKLDCLKTNDNKKLSYELDRFIIAFQEKYKFWYVYDKIEYTYITKIEFLHELQNVYFILNGEELTF